MHNHHKFCYRNIELPPEKWERKAAQDAENWAQKKAEEKAKRPKDYDVRWRAAHTSKMETAQKTRRLEEEEKQKKLADLNLKNIS